MSTFSSGFPAIRLRHYPEREELRIEEIKLLELSSLFPMSYFEKRISWRLQFNYSVPRDYRNESAHLWHLEGGVGLSLNAFSEEVLLYGLVLANIEVGNSLRKGLPVGSQAPVRYSRKPTSGLQNSTDRRNHARFGPNRQAKPALCVRIQSVSESRAGVGSPGSCVPHYKRRVKWSRYYGT